MHMRIAGVHFWEIDSSLAQQEKRASSPGKSRHQNHDQRHTGKGKNTEMRPAETHIKLAALWLFILLNIIFRDLHQFVMPGFLETIMTGQFNGMKITPELMLIGGVVVSVPISMVPLSLVLELRFARPLTFVAALITTVTMIPPAPIDLDDAYHLALQLIAMAAIVVMAWRWKPAPIVADVHYT